MDVAGSLAKGARPQVNLIPQQQEKSVIAIGALLPGEEHDGAHPKGASPQLEGEEKHDLRARMLSPLENSLLGPAPAPQGEGLSPGLAPGPLDRINPLRPHRKGSADRPGPESRLPAPPPGPRPTEDVVAGLAVAIVLACAVGASETWGARNPPLPPRRRKK
jgi:hypothetical protein